MKSCDLKNINGDIAEWYGTLFIVYWYHKCITYTHFETGAIHLLIISLQRSNLCRLLYGVDTEIDWNDLRRLLYGVNKEID